MKYILLLCLAVSAALSLSSCVNMEARKAAYFINTSPQSRAGLIWVDFDVENAGGFTQQVAASGGGPLGVLSDGISNGIMAGATRNDVTRKNLPVVKSRVAAAIEDQFAKSRVFRLVRSSSLQGVMRDKKTTFMPSDSDMKAFAARNSLQHVIAIRVKRRVPPARGMWEPRLVIQPVVDVEVKLVTADGKTLNYVEWGTIPDGAQYVPSTDVRDPSLNASWETAARDAIRKMVATLDGDAAKHAGRAL